MSWRRILVRGMIVLAGIAACQSGVDPATGAEKDADLLLKTFLAEFVRIEPGTGKFPDHLSVQGKDTSANAASLKLPVKQSFSIAKYEVTQELYAAVMGTNPSRWKGSRNSVELMNWAEANQFCERATQMLRERKLIAADEIVRLPTELEWEYCCRAGTSTAYSFGDELRRETDPPQRNSILDEYAWYTGNAAGNDPPVGALKPNPWGLYDMHGYLWEFTSDPWSDAILTEFEALRADPEDGGQIVIKGGSWKDPAEKLKTTARRSWKLADRDDAVGFRCVLSKPR